MMLSFRQHFERSSQWQGSQNDGGGRAHLALELVPDLLEMFYRYEHLLPIASQELLSPVPLDISVAPSYEPVDASGSHRAGCHCPCRLQPSFLRTGGLHGGDRQRIERMIIKPGRSHFRAPADDA